MKILKFNLSLIEKRKIIYMVMCVLLMFSLVDVFAVFLKANNQVEFIQNSKTADYLSILTNPFISMAPILIFGLPLLFNLILSDSTWIELNQGNSTFIYTRLDYVKNILIRYFLSICIVFLLSCFCFLINYISLSFIFGNGNIHTNFQDLAFDLEIAPEFFLDSLRLSNPVMYSIFFILHISVLYGLISGISYSLSFIFKKQMLVYFSSVLFITIFEFIVTKINLGNLSIMKQLQPFSFFCVSDALILYSILFILGVSLILIFMFKKKDLLL